MRQTHPTKDTAFARWLAAYSAVAAATAATTGHANAAEVVWDIADFTITDVDLDPSAQSGLLFNLITGATAIATDIYNDAPGQMRLTADFNGYLYGPSGPAAGNLGFVGALVTYGTGTSAYQLAVASPLASNATISPADNFAISGPYFDNFYAYLGFADGLTGTVGIRFDFSGGVHYGWAQITAIDDDNYTLHGFGYNNTPGAASTASNTIDGVIPGDTDGDGDVDDADLGTAFANYTGPNGTGKTTADGDYDNDGDVDDSDLGGWFSDYTGPLGPTVPEPGSLALLALGAAGLIGWRTRHADR